jgi:hypothetical protein
MSANEIRNYPGVCAESAHAHFPRPQAGRLRDRLENGHRYWINPEQPVLHTGRAALPQTARVSQ